MRNAINDVMLTAISAASHVCVDDLYHENKECEQSYACISRLLSLSTFLLSFKLGLYARIYGTRFSLVA